MALAEMGVRRLDEIVGRTDLLRLRNRAGEGLDLSCLLGAPPRATASAGLAPAPFSGDAAALDERLWADARSVVETVGPIRLTYGITNRDRAVGARLSGAIAARAPGGTLPPGTIDVELYGSAGQSFGAFLVSGMRLRLFGDAQDYVGKGMSGGEIVVRPPREASFASQDNVIAGNTLLYGATGGSLFAAGRVGERFAVRSSGAEAVVEGCGDHGCEYMTGGIAVVLGDTGVNFGAGMSGGVAYAWDPDERFTRRMAADQVRSEPLAPEDQVILRGLVRRHAEATESAHAATLLARWDALVGSFVKVVPATAPLVLEREAAGSPTA
jgi:glutamate synthase (ferredoxin)